MRHTCLHSRAVLSLDPSDVTNSTTKSISKILRAAKSLLYQQDILRPTLLLTTPFDGNRYGLQYTFPICARKKMDMTDMQPLDITHMHPSCPHAKEPYISANEA